MIEEAQRLIREIKESAQRKMWLRVLVAPLHWRKVQNDQAGY